MRPLLVAALLGASLVACGGVAGRSAPSSRSHPVAPRSGIGVDLPPGWHRLDPPITAVVDPTERLLLTSYPASRGGNCGPDRAERELPAGGALIYVFEYAGRPAAVGTDPARRAFPPRPAHFGLLGRALATYECWHVPSYLLRFSSADRYFQVHVALGPGISPAGRRQVLSVLDSLRVARATKASARRPAGPARGYTVRELEAALRTNPNREASRVGCAPATGADRREARRAFGRTRARLFVCRLDLGGGSAELFDVVLMRDGCFVGERRRPGAADYGCIR